MKLETRANSEAPAVAQTDGGRTIAGYAAVFNSPTVICGGLWTEVIMPGAFSESLRSGDDVLALYSHDRARLLGRSSTGTLRLTEDDKGLAVEIDLPDTTDGRDVAALVERRDLNGMSFGFCVTKQEWDETVDPPKRTILAVDLREVTVTADPAYDDTELGMRSLEEARSARRSHNFGEAAKRVSRKVSVDLRARGLTSKA